MESLRSHWETEAFPGVTAAVGYFRVDEALNETYLGHIELAFAEPDVEVAKMLGKDGVLIVEREPQVRRFVGVVAEVWEGQGHDAASDKQAFTRARVRLVPAFELLSLRRNTRIFQEKTVPEILEDVLKKGLGDYGRSATLELQRKYPKREYCVQYQETDLEFASRLMEEEGIFYSFDHEGEKEVMLLRDANAACQRAPSEADPISYRDDDLHARDREVVHAMTRAHRETTTAILVRDWDWTAGGEMRVETKKDGQDAAGRTRESYEHGATRSLTISSYDQGARRYQAEDSADQSEVRLQQHVVGAVIARGVGRVMGFAPGTTFELIEHPLVGMDGEFLITRVTHESVPAEGKLGRQGGEVEAYHNEFECIPVATEFRPPKRFDRPRIDSIQTAIVTGPAGEEIHVDEHGRIKIQFFWDRENPADETSSCWVRCEQAWAAASWGFWWVPRIGMEVVVHFVDGNPDRPIVTGCVYNAANTLPYPLPDEKTKSTIKSNSSPGGGGFNEFRFEDKAGSEEIYTHAQKDYDEVVEHDHTTTVHHDQTNTVDVDQTQTIHGNQTERVDANQKMTVGANRSIHVEGNYDETIDGTETRVTNGDVTETFNSTETRNVTGAVTESISGSETRTIGAGQTETVLASHDQKIGGASTVTIAGSLTQAVGGGISTTTPAAMTVLAGGSMTVTTGGPTKWVGPGGITLISPAGWTFIDSWKDWMGTLFVKVEGHGKCDTGMKLELGASVFYAVGAIVQTHGFHLNMNAAYEEKDGTATVGKALDAEGAVRLNILFVKAIG